MDKREQALIAAVIFGAIAVLLLAAANVAVYGAFNGGAPALVFVGAFFGMFGCGAALAALYGFRLASVRHV